MSGIRRRGRSLRRIRACALLTLMAAPSLAAGAPAEDWEAHIVLQAQDVTCGAAALAMLLSLEVGEHVSEAEIVDAMLRGRTMEAIREGGGFSLLDLLLYVESRGLAAVGEDALALSDLAERTPAIVPINDGGQPHFVVVAGSRAGRFAVADPARGPRWIDESEFARIWSGIAFALRLPR